MKTTRQHGDNYQCCKTDRNHCKVHELGRFAVQFSVNTFSNRVYSETDPSSEGVSLVPQYLLQGSARHNCLGILSNVGSIWKTSVKLHFQVTVFCSITDDLYITRLKLSVKGYKLRDLNY